jgi:hypothetical protein
MARLGDIRVEMDEQPLGQALVGQLQPTGSLRLTCWNPDGIALPGGFAAARRDGDIVWAWSRRGDLYAFGQSVQRWQVPPATSLFAQVLPDGRLCWTFGDALLVVDLAAGTVRAMEVKLGRQTMSVQRVGADVDWGGGGVIARVGLDGTPRKVFRRMPHYQRDARLPMRGEGVELPFVETMPVTSVRWISGDIAWAASRAWTADGVETEVEPQPAARNDRGFTAWVTPDYATTAPYLTEDVQIVRVRDPDGHVVWTQEVPGYVEVKPLEPVLELPHARVELGEPLVLWGDQELGRTWFGDDRATTAAVHPSRIAALVGTAAGRLYLVEPPRPPLETP